MSYPLIIITYSPVIVAPDANIQTAASRVMWAKCFNGGQVSLMLISVLQTKPTLSALNRSVLLQITS